MLDQVKSGQSLTREEELAKLGEKIIDRLQAGKLPQMVDWFDPGLLAKVGVRSVISATLGSYTDQRLIQAATDISTEEELKARYDYSGASATSVDPLLPDQNGAVWVDYVADLGDGFEATYAMAYLLAADELKVRGEPNALPAGKLLIMGGDQVYPDATKQEYHTRLRDPYDWAFTVDEPSRKLFAIPGNHDWYDGLSAFSALFCSARDRISGGLGTKIGGWRCHQHRSYFAIKLPHNWWIWGPDIQLADNLDDSQRDYFDLMADQTGKDDKIILCLAEPSWLHENYDNMHEISMLARKRGAKICAVIAGDWHHYSRYDPPKLGTQFITCGGGGAFAHATHGLKSTLSLKWARPTGDRRKASTADTLEFNRLESAVIGPGGTDFTQSSTGAAGKKPGAVTPEPKPITDIEPGHSRRDKVVVSRQEIASSANDYECLARQIYPTRWTSRLLCLKNLVLPFRNKRFAVLVGIVYFVYAWAWAASDPRQSPIMLKLSADIAAQTTAAQNALAAIDGDVEKILEQRKRLTVEELTGPVGLAASQELDRALLSQERARKALAGIRERNVDLDGGRKAKLIDDVEKFERTKGLDIHEKIAALTDIFREYNSLKHVLDPTAFLAAAEQSPMFAFLLIGLWIGLVSYVELPAGWLGKTGKLLFGSIHFLAHVGALLLISWIVTGASAPVTMLLQSSWPGSPWPDVLRIVWNFGATLLLGGLLGGFVMGLYWTLTSTLFNMHTGDAFGALGIKDYKCFLRIKLEPDRATIYPIALDKVPGPSGWRWRLKDREARPSHSPQILPVKPLEPRLIEPPIGIDVSRVEP